MAIYSNMCPNTFGTLYTLTSAENYKTTPDITALLWLLKNNSYEDT